ncbi:DNA-binding transcriptional MerR regulator [Sporosarcina luteola]|nr:DNA-binding transcriptional MerR regulator [Sporosarcina luteola]
MEQFMTIQVFSEKVGIAKSAIRYYEDVGLLGKVIRNASGYRLYEESHIEKVRLITSLRMADIAIEEIQQYFIEGNENERHRMMEAWIGTLRARREVLDTSLRYLESHPFPNRIYLTEKSAETIIWFSETSPIGRFGEAFQRRSSELKERRIPILNSYLQYESGRNVIQARIGFGVPEGTEIADLQSEVTVEKRSSFLCIVMPHTEGFQNIRDGYEKLEHYAMSHGWRPVGPMLEWYRGSDLSKVEMLLPVVQIKGKEGLE